MNYNLIVDEQALTELKKKAVYSFEFCILEKNYGKRIRRFPKRKAIKIE